MVHMHHDNQAVVIPIIPRSQPKMTNTLSQTQIILCRIRLPSGLRCVEMEFVPNQFLKRVRLTDVNIELFKYSPTKNFMCPMTPKSGLCELQCGTNVANEEAS